VQVEGGFLHTAKLHQTYFGKAPEAFDAVNVIGADGKFIVRMIDPIVLLIAQIDDAVVDPKPVGMDNGSNIDFAFDNRIKRFTRAVRNDLGVNLSVSFVDAENDRFTVSSTTPLAANTSCTFVAIRPVRFLPKMEIRSRNIMRSADESMSNIGSPCCGLTRSIMRSAKPSDQVKNIAISVAISCVKFGNANIL